MNNEDQHAMIEVWQLELTHIRTDRVNDGYFPHPLTKIERIQLKRIAREITELLEESTE